MKATPPIVQYREKALNAAALLTALSSAAPDPTSRTSELVDRQHALIEQLLHEFAFYARKTLERLDASGTHVLTAASERRILSNLELIESEENPGVAESAEPTWHSLSFVLGRLIHSAEIVVQRGPVPVPETDPPVFQNLAWGFEVRSDLDVAEKRHFVFVQFLLERFLEVIESAEAESP